MEERRGQLQGLAETARPPPSGKPVLLHLVELFLFFLCVYIHPGVIRLFIFLFLLFRVSWGPFLYSSLFFYA